MSANIESGMFDDARRTVQRLAVDAFKDHALTEEGDCRWICKRAGGGAYWFRLITAPGSIVIIGDVGECILRPYCKQHQVVSWLRGAVNSPAYFVEKVQASKTSPFAFYPEEAIKWLNDYAKEMADENADYARRVSDAWAAASEMHDGDGLSQHDYLRIASDAGIDDAYDVGRYLSSRMLWMIEVCRCFVRLHDAAIEGAAVKSAEAEAVQ